MSVLVHPHTPRVAVDCRCALGEEATWDDRTGTLTWVDIENPAIWRYRPETGQARRFPVDETIGFALRTPDPDIVLAGFRSGVARYHLFGGRRELLVRPEAEAPGNRLNSGQVGPDGTLYFSSMDDAEAEPTGSFYHWDGTVLTAFGGAAAVTNGPVVSPDGRCLYTADTANGIVRVHERRGGAIGPAEPFVVFETGWGKPDGLTVDAHGYLWVCHYGGGRITRFAPDATIERILPVPAARVTKCAFGGANLTTLYITTALRGGDPTLDPMSGHLFAIETDIRGLPSHVFSIAGDFPAADDFGPSQAPM